MQEIRAQVVFAAVRSEGETGKALLAPLVCTIINKMNGLENHKRELGDRETE